MVNRVLKSGLLVVALSLGLIINAFAFTTYGPIKRGETLWSVAKKTRPNKHISIDLMMSAIQKLNPQAFDDLSKGTLHIGAKIQIPSNATELRDVLHGKMPSNTGIENTAVNEPTPASIATAGAEPTVNTTANSATSNSRNRGESQNIIAQLQQQLQAAEQAKVTTAAEAASQLQAAQQKIAELQQANAQLQSEVGAFPWSWLWFILLALLGAYWYWDKHHQSARATQDESDHAFETTDEIAESDLFDDQTANEIGNGSVLADALIAMAEGDYKMAKRLLLNGIREEHDNIELRMKLLEVYVQLNDRDAFNAESDYLLKNLINETDDAWKTVRAMYLKKWVYDA